VESGRLGGHWQRADVHSAIARSAAGIPLDRQEGLLRYQATTQGVIGQRVTRASKPASAPSAALASLFHNMKIPFTIHKVWHASSERDTWRGELCQCVPSGSGEREGQERGAPV
jgi:hypothetical protein